MSSRVRAVAVAAAFLTLAPAVAAAQSATPPKGAPDGAIPVIVAPPETDKKARAATPVSAAELALAREVVLLQTPFDSLTEVVESLVEADAAYGELTLEQRRIMGEAIVEEMTERREQIIDLFAAVYARVLTEDEMRSWLAFLNTPHGRAISAKSAALGLESVRAGEEMAALVLPGAMRRALPRLDRTQSPTVPGQDS